MTRHAYTLLQSRREVIAARIRHALSHDRSQLKRLYAEAQALAMESLWVEVGNG